MILVDARAGLKEAGYTQLIHKRGGNHQDSMRSRVCLSYVTVVQ